MIYEATTCGIRVRVRPGFLDERSDPDAGQYLWAYSVEITNASTRTVQLLKRTWEITDATGQRKHVHGDGVVGEQPVLEPGEAFTYTSGVPLPTPSGFMSGQYHMVDADGAAFDIEVPSFSLDSPHARTKMH